MEADVAFLLHAGSLAADISLLLVATAPKLFRHRRFFNKILLFERPRFYQVYGNLTTN
jgi:hypothetical protein